MPPALGPQRRGQRVVVGLLAAPAGRLVGAPGGQHGRQRQQDRRDDLDPLLRPDLTRALAAIPRVARGEAGRGARWPGPGLGGRGRFRSRSRVRRGRSVRSCRLGRVVVGTSSQHAHDHLPADDEDEPEQRHLRADRQPEHDEADRDEADPLDVDAVFAGSGGRHGLGRRSRHRRRRGRPGRARGGPGGGARGADVSARDHRPAVRPGRRRSPGRSSAMTTSWVRLRRSARVASATARTAARRSPSWIPPMRKSRTRSSPAGRTGRR